MSTRWQIGLLCGLMMAGTAGRLWAAAAPAAPGAAEAKPAPSPEEQAALDLIKRFQVEKSVQSDQNRFLAEQHVAVGKAHLGNQAWADARRQFEEALKLDPTNKDATDGLRTARSMLGVVEPEFGKMITDYTGQRKAAIEMQKTELMNMFDAAKALYDKGQYVDAIEGFTRAAARGRYLSPNVEVGRLVEDCESLIQKSMAKIEENRVKGEDLRRRRAEEDAKQVRGDRAKLLDERTQALYRQAQTLFNERRYSEAMKVCDEILRKDPANGPAQTLSETARDAARQTDIDAALKERRTETQRHWQETEAWCVPYSQVRPYMPRDKFEEVRARKAPTAIGGDMITEQEWERRIKEALNKKVTFDFVETPLQDVVNFLSSLVDVTIVLDTAAVKDVPPVTLRVNEMRLQSALNWILKLVALKYTLKDEAVFISKAEAIQEKAILRMYDVTDLTIDIKNFQGRQQALASDSGYSSTGSQGGSMGGGGGGGGSGMAEEFFGGDEDQNKEKDKLTGESLVEFIRKTIAPGTWADDAVPGADNKGF